MHRTWRRRRGALPTSSATSAAGAATSSLAEPQRLRALAWGPAVSVANPWKGAQPPPLLGSVAAWCGMHNAPQNSRRRPRVPAKRGLKKVGAMLWWPCCASQDFAALAREGGEKRKKRKRVIIFQQGRPAREEGATNLERAAHTHNLGRHVSSQHWGARSRAALHQPEGPGDAERREQALLGR